RYFADDILWLVFVSVLAVFDVEKGKYEAGNDIEIFEDQITDVQSRSTTW
ncbi:hypothetical protein NEOLEDRAFT_1077649, partial [Neolentinus lepideus HHB14362 ss-1]